MWRESNQKKYEQGFDIAGDEAMTVFFTKICQKMA